MAGWLEFLAAEFALHRRFPRFPTFRCFPVSDVCIPGGISALHPRRLGGGVPGVPALVSESDAERFERHRACFHFLSASQQRSCVFVCLVALHPVASAVREPAVSEAVWITAT